MSLVVDSIEFLNPSDVVGQGLTPERSNYLDVYDFTDNNIPQLRENAIKKFDNRITGILKKISNTERLTSNKYMWTELERRAVTYDDAVLTVGTDNVLTRADSGKILYRLHEKVRLHTSDTSGVFIVTEVTSSTSVKLGTYNAESEAIISDYTAALTGVYVYSLGIEVGMGSEGADFNAGIRTPYKILSNRPAITRNVYTENGSTPPVIKWVKINGQPKWFLGEIDENRDDFLEMVEKKCLEGEFPSATSDAAANGLQGTTGVFEQIRTNGVTFQDLIEDVDDLEALIAYYDKVNGAGQNLFLCNRDQEFAFDSLARTFNAGYGNSETMDNYIGDYNNADSGKVLKLGFKGFQYGGYTFLKQGAKYFKENTFRGNSAIPASERINFMAIPIGMTPVSEGDQSLEFNPSTVMRNYMTIFAPEGREYKTWTEGGAWIKPETNGNDSFKVHWLNESLPAVFNAEKFILGEGTSV